jgi:hypothetical protein
MSGLGKRVWGVLALTLALMTLFALQVGLSSATTPPPRTLASGPAGVAGLRPDSVASDLGSDVCKLARFLEPTVSNTTQFVKGLYSFLKDDWDFGPLDGFTVAETIANAACSAKDEPALNKLKLTFPSTLPSLRVQDTTPGDVIAPAVWFDSSYGAVTPLLFSEVKAHITVDWITGGKSKVTGVDIRLDPYGGPWTQFSVEPISGVYSADFTLRVRLDTWVQEAVRVDNHDGDADGPWVCTEPFYVAHYGSAYDLIYGSDSASELALSCAATSVSRQP